MNKQQIGLTAAAVLAALAMSACSAETAGGPTAATTTATTTAVRPAAETATATTTKVSTVSKYENVTGQGQIHRGSADRQYGLGSPVPGAEIATFDEQDRVKPEGCTLGPAVISGGRTGFLMAGHCSVVGAPETYVAIGPDTDDTVLLGVPDMVSTSVFDDSAVLWAEAAAGIDRIAGTWPVDGVMPLDELAILDPGTWVCINGTEAGVKCAELEKVDGTRIETEELSHDGDSGAAMFVVDIVTKRATLIGVVSQGGESADTIATALAPALARIGAEVITAP